MTINAIIFDWAKTLFDTDLKKEFPETEEVLKYCKEKGYKLALASLVNAPIETNITIEARKAEIENSYLRKYFDFVAVTDGDKDKILDDLVSKLNLPRQEIMIVDDRVIRGVKYGNNNGHPTVWFRNGTFENEMPNFETGFPTYVLQSLLELKSII